MRAFKFLRPDGTGPFTGFSWPLDEWVQAPLAPCRSGIHACRTRDLPLWLGRTLYEVELGGRVVEEPSKLVAERGRLVRRVEAWDAAAYDDYVRVCADRALALTGAHRLEEWAEMVEPAIPEGGAVMGFIAANIAEQVDGPDGYLRERALQADWLAERLAL